MKLALMSAAALAAAFSVASHPAPAQAESLLGKLGGAAARGAARAGQGDSALVDATDPQRLVALMQEEGYRAELGVDGVGDPEITSATGGAAFHVQFYDCDDDNRNCRSLLFRSGFDLDAPMALEDINAWNRGRRFGSAWLDDEGDPFLEMSVTLDGGVSEANFADIVDWWSVALGEFTEHIGW